MSKRKSKFGNVLLFWLVSYPTAIFVGLLVIALRLTGWLKINGLENLPKYQKSVLLVSNHPSLWEPIILVGLFFPQYLFHPVKQGPWSTPDQQNYTDKWYWGIFRSRFISVPRGRRRGELRALIEIIKVLRMGGNVILFPEGGRTSRGEHFVYSASLKYMRELKNGVGRIICRTNCTVVPVWIDGAEKVLPVGTWLPRVWRGMTLTVGKSFCRTRMEKPQKSDFALAGEIISAALLKTAG